MFFRRWLRSSEYWDKFKSLWDFEGRRELELERREAAQMRHLENTVSILILYDEDYLNAINRMQTWLDNSKISITHTELPVP